MNEDSTIGWMLGGIATALGVMATAITTLWKTSEAKNAVAISVLEKRADSCEEDRELLRDEVTSLRVEVRLLKQQNGQDQ